MASVDWMCNGHQATSQTTKVEVSPEGWRLKIQELVAEPHGRLRDITLEAHRDYTLPVASPERVALFGVILPAGTNPLNHFKEPSCKRFPATRKLEGNWHEGLRSGVEATLVRVHLSAFGAAGSACDGPKRAMLVEARAARYVRGGDIQQQEAALSVHPTNRDIGAVLRCGARLRVAE